jgi:hypothetical protein
MNMCICVSTLVGICICVCVHVYRLTLHYKKGGSFSCTQARGQFNKPGVPRSHMLSYGKGRAIPNLKDR